MDDRKYEIWKGQALNIAKDELLSTGKVFDLDEFFKRGKQIYYKAFDHDFFEWKPPKEKVIKEKCDWVECKKCHQLADRAHYENCRCGEPIPKKE